MTRIFRTLALGLAALLAAPLAALADVDIQEVKSPGGLTAWLVEDHTIPFLALELRFRGGASLDAPGKRGAINLMTATLEEGAGDLDARGFARALEELAASFRYRASDDAIAVSAKMLTENREAALALLRDSLIAPRFDADAVERVRGQVLSGLRADATDPESIVARTFDAQVFGDHPYGSQMDGTIETVSALTREDMQAAHRATFARDRLYISAVGDITAEELAALIDDLLLELPESGAPMPQDVTPRLDGGVTVVDFDTPQSIALFAQEGMTQEDPDFFAAYLLDLILGGGSFESRLMQEVREKRGLTYGVYSYLADMDHAQLWRGSVASSNDRIAEAITVIRDEWRRLRDEGVTAEELEDAKTYLTGAYPLRFDGNGPIANIIVNMQMQGLPIDYAATRNDRVNAVTLDDINRVARERLDPEALSFVVVGRPVGLEEAAAN